MTDPKRLMEFTDDVLCTGFRELVLTERGNLVDQLDYLGELDRRKLFWQYDSLRDFVVGELGLETSVAEKRIKIARLLRRYPALRAPLEQGKLGIRLIEIGLGYRHREGLEDEDFLRLLKDFEGKTVEAASREAARLYPHSTELPADQVRPFNEEHAILSIAIPFEVLEAMEEARALLAHSYPELSKAELIRIVFSDYLKRHHPARRLPLLAHG